jgi:hypothetical protein
MQFIFHSSYSYSYISNKLLSQGYLKIAWSDLTKTLLRRYQHFLKSILWLLYIWREMALVIRFRFKVHSYFSIMYYDVLVYYLIIKWCLRLSLIELILYIWQSMCIVLCTVKHVSSTHSLGGIRNHNVSDDRHWLQR